MTRPGIGRPAPAIELTDPSDGSLWHLADRKGRATVLIFHRHIH